MVWWLDTCCEMARQRICLHHLQKRRPRYNNVAMSLIHYFVETGPKGDVGVDLFPQFRTLGLFKTNI